MYVCMYVTLIKSLDYIADEKSEFDRKITFKKQLFFWRILLKVGSFILIRFAWGSIFYINMY